MNKYAISWTENKQEHWVLWDGEDFGMALKGFYESYDDVDRKGISNVEIYFLSAIPVNTEYKGK